MLFWKNLQKKFLMKKISESEIIKLVKDNNNFREEVIIPIGEDASAIFPKQDVNMVLTTDTMVLNTHFKDDITPYELGYISAASNISDISAMGAYPAFVLINLTLLNNSDEYIKELINGYNSLFSQFPVTVIGGDTTYGPTSITMTLIGYSNSNNFMATNDSKENDIIFISGSIGDSFSARKKGKYNLPVLRNELANLLPDFAHSCTDMSDGLINSINMITKKSNLGAKIKLEKIKINKETSDLICNKKSSWNDILSYGEDYELLFTIPIEKCKPFKNICDKLGFEIHNIGNLTKDKKIEFYKDEVLENINIRKKFNHFKT
jgi:thiamine-monophosphate kinase